MLPFVLSSIFSLLISRIRVCVPDVSLYLTITTPGVGCNVEDLTEIIFFQSKPPPGGQECSFSWMNISFIRTEVWPLAADCRIERSKQWKLLIIITKSTNQKIKDEKRQQKELLN